MKAAVGRLAVFSGRPTPSGAIAPAPGVLRPLQGRSPILSSPLRPAGVGGRFAPTAAFCHRPGASLQTPAMGDWIFIYCL